MNANGRVLLFIVVAFVVFRAGRQWQRSADLWRTWREAVKNVPARRTAAWGGARAMVKVGLVAAVILWAVANLNYFL
ncbi:hypothetical protein [Microbispora sp. ATCC PTA-5024]|uniref:hypothetical protein n=1 Tax=Microbispora sp. ATCC PTA-5024 TaxID=316330 RepID=UPI0003DC7B47|nr:hypothetical protein [Microbispora sp. ATCC PTA-5024]ETK32407.1 hypothetical protein MPTA5024_30025 [Microbispora sp. ATCC PTA-5024]